MSLISNAEMSFYWLRLAAELGDLPGGPRYAWRIQRWPQLWDEGQAVDSSPRRDPISRLRDARGALVRLLRARSKCR